MSFANLGCDAFGLTDPVNVTARRQRRGHGGGLQHRRSSRPRSRRRQAGPPGGRTAKHRAPVRRERRPRTRSRAWPATRPACDEQQSTQRWPWPGPGRHGVTPGYADNDRQQGQPLYSRCQQLDAPSTMRWRPGQAKEGPAYDGGMTRPTGEAELRPVIVTVDDDPSVSRAVARDLRRRYGERNRIVRAESGEQALDALRQMKLRGDQVAVHPRGLPDARAERHRVPRAGDGHLPVRPAGAADRVRGHQRRDRRDQHGGPGPLPAQALGPAGGEALPGHRRPARAPGSARSASRSRRPSWSATAGRRRRRSCATSSPATRCPTAGTPRTPTRASGCSTRRARTAGTCRCSSPPTASR